MVKNPPVFAIPRSDLPYSIDMDASGTRWDLNFSILLERHKKTISVWSKALNKAQWNFLTPVNECPAVVFAVKKARPYVQGEEFAVFAYCSTLLKLFEVADPSGRLMRRRLRLEECRFATEYKKGIKDWIGDSMSWMGSENNAIVDSEGNLPSYPTYREVEHQLSTHCSVDCQIVASDDGFTQLFTLGNYEFDLLDAVLAVQIYLPEV